MSSNYPPGVTGNEEQIVGAPEWERFHETIDRDSTERGLEAAQAREAWRLGLQARAALEAQAEARKGPEKVLQIQMAKASEQDLRECGQLVALVEAVSYRWGPHWPAEEPDEDGEPPTFDCDSYDDVKRFHERVVELADGLARVVMGYQVLLDNCADPEADVLKFKPGLVKLDREEAGR